MDRTFLIQILLVFYLHDSLGTRDTLEDKSLCNTGKFGNRCQHNCSSSCNFNKCIVSHDKGIPECDKGCREYYTGIFCQEFCPNLCLECNQTRGTCEKCIDGYYGLTCNMTCHEDCLNKTCHMNGSCFLAPKTDIMNQPQSANRKGNCLKKTEDGSGCQCCKPGHRGHICKVCENCKTYYIPNKVCKYLCQDGYYGQTCSEECPKFCHQGNSGKPICEFTNSYLRCKNGCTRGRTGKQCSDKCSENCKSNTCFQMGGNCVDCPNGKYGDICSDTCSSGCVNETCSRDGTCTGGCKTGMFGKSCNKTCPETCFTCWEDFDTGLANCSSDCKPGSHGSLCQDTCNEACKDNICNPMDGRCVHGCKPGYYNIRCNKKCSEGCHGNACTIEDGSCLEGCKPGFHGYNCTGICGINCVKRKCEDQVNPNSTFVCSEGCKNGYKGLSCDQKCHEHCMSCNQFSGNGCLQCENGYNLRSNDDGHLSCLKTDSEPAMPQRTIIIITVFTTAVISCLLCMAVIYILRRRRLISCRPLIAPADAPGEDQNLMPRPRNNST